MDSQDTYQTKLFFTPEAPFGSARKRPWTRRFLLTAPLSLIILLALPISSLAQSALTDDAYVLLFQGDKNNGAERNLSVSPRANAYLKFNLSSTLPKATPGSKVGRATIKLYVDSIKAAGKLDVYQVLGPWDENVITGANAPPLGNLLTTTGQIGTDQNGKFIVIDVTPLVRQWLGDDGQGTNGIPNHGLALLAHPAEATSREMIDITFDSKENSHTSHEAQLNVQWESAVEHDATLSGDGATASPLGVASGSVNAAHLADGAVTRDKIGANAVTSVQLADGAVTSSKVNAPLSLTSAGQESTLSVSNTGSGAAITAAGAIDTSVQFNIGGQRVLSNPGTNNLFAGTGAGENNATGVANAFFGKNAGQANMSGSSNSFVGNNAGAGNTTGGNNSFFGDAAGFRNAGGRDNSFFGFLAGFNNTAFNNSYFGSFAGAENTTGFHNSFFGARAGASNTTGGANAFFGANAGASNTTGGANAFFGREAGLNNTTGSVNAFFGTGAGALNTAGELNSFFGANSGSNNTTGGNNSFFGQSAGQSNTTGSNNVFIGRIAGFSNTTGSSLTVIGANANVGANDLTFATAIGAGASVGASNTVVLGRSADTVQVPGGLNIAGALNLAGSFGAEILNAGTQFNIGGLRVLSVPGNNNLFVGLNSGNANTSGSVNTFFGNNAGKLNTQGQRNSFFGESAGLENTFGDANTFIGAGAGEHNTTGRINIFIGAGAGAAFNTQVSNSIVIGVNQTVSSSNTVVLGNSTQTTQIPGGMIVRARQGAGFNPALEVSTSDIGGAVIANNLYIRQFNELGSPAHLCWRVSGSVPALALTTCTSSFSSSQLKTGSQPFSGGLDIIKRLNPVTFSWIGDTKQDIGLNAEDVAEVEPLLVTRNEKGEAEDLKENSLDVIFINAFKEQQKQLEAQQELIRLQQQQIDALKKLVCSANPQADLCKAAK
jgi:hypothetical protein